MITVPLSNPYLSFCSRDMPMKILQRAFFFFGDFDAGEILKNLQSLHQIEMLKCINQKHILVQKLHKCPQFFHTGKLLQISLVLLSYPQGAGASAGAG